MSILSELTRGIIKENPTFRLVLGMCPTLALTTSLAVSPLLAWRTGTAGFGELTAVFGWRSLIPGLLGTFFVFASLVGYQRLGAGTTISVLVASQLICGLIADAVRSGGGRLDAPTLIGTAMLGVGTLLVARG